MSAGSSGSRRAWQAASQPVITRSPCSAAAPRRRPKRESGTYETVRVPSTYVLESRLGVPYPVPSPALVGHSATCSARTDVVHVNDAVYATSVASLLGARRRRLPSVLPSMLGSFRRPTLHSTPSERLALATIASGARLATVVATLQPRRRRLGREDLADRGTAGPPGGRSRTTRGAGPTALRYAARSGFPKIVSSRSSSAVTSRRRGSTSSLAAGDPAYELVAVTDRAGSATGLETPAVHAARSARRAAPRRRRLRASVGRRRIPAHAAGGLRHRAPRCHDDAARVRALPRSGRCPRDRAHP